MHFTTFLRVSAMQRIDARHKSKVYTLALDIWIGKPITGHGMPNEPAVANLRLARKMSWPIVLRRFVPESWFAPRTHHIPPLVWLMIWGLSQAAASGRRHLARENKTHAACKGLEGSASSKPRSKAVMSRVDCCQVTESNYRGYSSMTGESARPDSSLLKIKKDHTVYGMVK